MLLRLMKYDLHVKYSPGKEMYIADTLSRAYIETDSGETNMSDHLEVCIHSILESLPMSDRWLDLIQDASKDDQEFQALLKMARKGWPAHRRDTPSPAKLYWHVRDEIHVENELVFVGERIMIPRSLRAEILEKIHEGHLGMDKCKMRAREIVYWPGMSREIEDMVARCNTCALYRRGNQREPLILHELPHRPWAKLGADIFTFGNADYLIVVDYFSKYPEVLTLQNKTAKEIIQKFKSIFARHGIPDELVSDNMPFASHDMIQFAQDWNFSLTTSSPTYAQSNGQSERFVQTIKQIMRKALEAGTDIHIALLQYRDSPVAGTTYSPAQLLMSRRLRSNLPIARSRLTPQVPGDAHKQLMGERNRFKTYYDRGTQPLKPLSEGDNVRIARGRKWMPAVLHRKHDAPRSYVVLTPDGHKLRRNRKHLQKCHGKPPLVIPEAPDVIAEQEQVTIANVQHRPMTQHLLLMCLTVLTTHMLIVARATVPLDYQQNTKTM